MKTGSKARTALVALITALCAVATAPCQAALVLRPPGLHAGDQFRVVFISSQGHDARSSDIAVYDDFINGLAAAAGIDTYFGAAVNWQVLGSTFAVSALDRVGLDSPTLVGMSGATIADDGADLWDGSIDNAIMLDERGSARDGVVYTGTRANGRTADSPLGGAGVFITELGLSNLIVTNQGWISVGAGGGTTLRPLYGVSSLLTVPPDATEVPEPGALALAGLALAGAAAARRRVASF